MASRYRRLLRGEPAEARLPPLPGFELFFGFRAGSAISGQPAPELVLPTFKTQNDARGAWTAPARQIDLIADCKSPKLPILPTA